MLSHLSQSLLLNCCIPSPSAPSAAVHLHTHTADWNCVLVDESTHVRVPVRGPFILAKPVKSRSASVLIEVSVQIFSSFIFTKVSPTFPAAVSPDRYNTFHYNHSLNAPHTPSLLPPLLLFHLNPHHVHIPADDKRLPIDTITAANWACALALLKGNGWTTTTTKYRQRATQGDSRAPLSVFVASRAEQIAEQSAELSTAAVLCRTWQGPFSQHDSAVQNWARLNLVL